MLRFGYTIALALAALSYIPIVAEASVCVPLAKAEADLKQQFGEEPLAQYTSKRGSRVILFVSPGSHTVTVFSVRGEDGAEMACVLDAGDDFQPAVSAGRPS